MPSARPLPSGPRPSAVYFGNCREARAAGAAPDVLIRGGSCIVDPLGKVLVAPSFEGEGIFLAEIDLGEIARGKYDLDVVGHYARPDIFQLSVNRARQAPVSFPGEAGQQAPRSA